MIELRPSDAENLAGQDTGREALSHSRLSTFLACHRKFELHYQERLDPISRPEPLSMGSAFQKAIELQNPDAGVLTLNGYTYDPTAPDEFRREDPWIDPAEPIHFHTQEAEDRHRVNCAIVRAAAALYLRKWPEPPGETREFEYRVRLRNPWSGHYSRTFDLLGYADGLIERTFRVGEFLAHPDVPEGWMVPNEALPLELVENKLVGAVTNVMVQRLPLDRQLALARYGIWRATGRQVRTVHFRWIKKPSIKRRQKETLDEFLDRIASDYVERPDFYAYEPPASFITAADLLRVEMELWTWAEQVRQLRRQRVFDRNTSHCSDFGGCQFIPICTGDPDAMSLYRTRPERGTA